MTPSAPTHPPGTVGGDRLDPDRPCWQEVADEDADIPEAVFACFREPLDHYKGRVGSHDQDMDFGDEVADRLQPFGDL